MIETATDIYISVAAMLRECELELRFTADPRKQGEHDGLLRVLHVLQDDFGVLPTPYDDAPDDRHIPHEVAAQREA